MKARTWLVLVALAAMTAGGSIAQAAAWTPQRPIRLVVGFGPGSGADMIGRILAEKLATELNTSVVVENREGAGSAIGAAAVAKSPADGYTLMLAATPMVVAPHLQTSMPYDPVNDFTPIVKVAELPLLLVVPTDAPFSTPKELVAYAKANPGKLSYATSGKGSPSHLSVAMISNATGIDVRDIPYKSVSQAMTDTIGGRVSFYFPAFPAGRTQAEAGKVKALAIGATKRSPQLPDVPTLAESLGIEGLEVITWYGLVGPVGLPKDVQATIYEATVKAMQSTEIRAAIQKGGTSIVVAAPPEFAAQIAVDDRKYRKLVNDLGLKQ